MDSGMGMWMTLLNLLEGALQLLVALIPLAIWQRTKIVGFLLLALSYAAGAGMSIVASWVFSLAGGGMAIFLVWRVLAIGVVLLAAVGLWQAYGALKQRLAPA